MKVSSVAQSRGIRIQEKSGWAWLASLFFGGRPTAMVLGSTIHLSGVKEQEFLRDKRWVLHELEHIRQFQHYGFVNFLLQYFWESVRKGYYNNRFEIEARNAENR